MKKYILGAIFGALVFMPLSVSAWVQQQTAKPIYGFECERKEFEDEQRGCSGSVHVFDDQENKCYVAIGNDDSPNANPSVSISCIATQSDSKDKQ